MKMHLYLDIVGQHIHCIIMLVLFYWAETCFRSCSQPTNLNIHHQVKKHEVIQYTFK